MIKKHHIDIKVKPLYLPHQSEPENSQYVFSYTVTLLNTGSVAARLHGAAEVIEARDFAVGSISETFESFPHLGPEVPAMGYSEEQIKDLEETLRRTPADLVLDASPAKLSRRVRVEKPIVSVEYEFAERGDALPAVLESFADVDPSGAAITTAPARLFAALGEQS